MRLFLIVLLMLALNLGIIKKQSNFTKTCNNSTLNLHPLHMELWLKVMVIIKL